MKRRESYLTERKYTGKRKENGEKDGSDKRRKKEKTHNEVAPECRSPGRARSGCGHRVRYDRRREGFDRRIREKVDAS